VHVLLVDPQGQQQVEQGLERNEDPCEPGNLRPSVRDLQDGRTIIFLAGKLGP